jgi:hypothetical protein
VLTGSWLSIPGGGSSHNESCLTFGGLARLRVP